MMKTHHLQFIKARRKTMQLLLRFTLTVVLCTAIISLKENGVLGQGLKLSPFEIALETLQKQIGYTFKNIGLLRRAMTHSSFSEENNRALSILGSNLIDASVSLASLRQDIETTSKDLNRRVAEISNVESSCAVDGSRLGLQRVIRVSPKTNSSTPPVLCGAFRAVFGAVAIDTDTTEDAAILFWKVHGGSYGGVAGLDLEM